MKKLASGISGIVSIIISYLAWQSSHPCNKPVSYLIAGSTLLIFIFILGWSKIVGGPIMVVLRTLWVDRELQEFVAESEMDSVVSGLEEEITSAFPLLLFSILTFLLSGVLIVDTMLGIDNQIYGLMFDTLGAVLLAKELVVDVSGGSVNNHQKQNKFLRMWGLFLLSFGFFLQFLTLLPWERSLSCP